MKSEDIPSCKHGIRLGWEQEFIEYGGMGPFKDTLPGRAHLTPPECPTPYECFNEAIAKLKDEGKL